MLLGSSLHYQSWHHHSYYLSVCVDDSCNWVIPRWLIFRTRRRYLRLGHLQMHLPLIVIIPWWPEKRSCQSYIPTWSSFVSVSATTISAAGSSPDDSLCPPIDCHHSVQIRALLTTRPFLSSYLDFNFWPLCSPSRQSNTLFTYFSLMPSWADALWLLPNRSANAMTSRLYLFV